jgi:hypothetical protein
MTAEDRHLLLLKKKMGVYWPSRQLLLLQKKTGLDWPSLFRFLFREGRRRLEEVFQALDLFDAIDQAEREEAARQAIVAAAWTVCRRRQLAVIEKALEAADQERSELQQWREGLEECRAELAETTWPNEHGEQISSLPGRAN